MCGLWIIHAGGTVECSEPAGRRVKLELLAVIHVQLVSLTKIKIIFLKLFLYSTAAGAFASDCNDFGLVSSWTLMLS